MSEIDTGVEDSRVAAETAEAEVLDESMLPEYEDEAEDISLAEFFEDEEAETVVDSGDDNPPEESDEENEQEQTTEPAQEQNKGVDQSKAFAERLRQETQKIERRVRAELEAKYAPAREAQIEVDARKLMEENPKMNMTLEFAKTIVKSQQPTPEVQEQQLAPEDENAARIEAWQQSLIDEEPMLKLQLNDPSITVVGYAQKNPAFDAALRVGNTPMQALLIAKKLESVFKQTAASARADGQKNVLQQVKNSNARATTPVSNVKSGGKTLSAAERIWNTPMEDLDKALENGGRIYVGD